ncbi:MAG: PhoH family protein [Candidatus Omnitrophota bacterium]|nr:PhoH family protein [Candidatus Omnitrophota bacterium]
MERLIDISNNDEARQLFGSFDENLKTVESNFGVKIVSRGEKLAIKGAKRSVDNSARLLEEMLFVIRRGGAIKRDELSYSIRSFKINPGVDLEAIYLDRIEVSSRRQFITPKTQGQKKYIDAIREHDIVFGVGPAGTGKTYLAMAMAVNALKRREVSRIILTRPAIEAGESLGYLPGDLYQKVTPYLRPLYDALYDMMEISEIQDSIERGVIEVAPLAYMRGRTLNDSFIILDEAQNSTTEQMKMFLTRLGFDSKTVITGDNTQSDLPSGRESGLTQVQKILSRIKGIAFAYFTGEDVVRHSLVQEIIKAYEENSK